MRVLGDDFGVVEQRAFGGRKAGFVELARDDGRYALFGGSLDTQEVGVAVQSILAAVEAGDPTGEEFLVAAREMAFGKVYGVGKFDDLAQEIGPRAEALDDAWKLLASGTRAPEIVSGGDVAGGLGVFRDANLCLRLGFWLGVRLLGIVHESASEKRTLPRILQFWSGTSRIQRGCWIRECN